VRTRFGEFILDSGTRQLFRDGGEVHVSPKAFDLLRTLLERRPGVVTKQEIFGRIWPGTFVGDANLNVLIGEVRRAVADEARAPRFIRTVHGVGYAFCGEAADVSSAAEARTSLPTRFRLEGKDRNYPLDVGDHIIGRDPASAVWLNDASVSRRHARIRIPAGSRGAILDDLDSTNGTFIGRRRVEASAPLADGNVIQVGTVELTFRESGDALAPTRRVRRGPRDRS
jgi:DNA-binding winged helix-turn-helix (wHTH) protein